MSVIPVIEEGKEQDPIYVPMDMPMPRPLPPRPSTAIGGGFTPRFRAHEGFSGKSFLFGVFVTSVFFFILGLLAA